MPKQQLPETRSQAETWDRLYSGYKRAGFCRRCAAQAAWGHQLGFNQTQPVGDCCRGKQPPRDLDRVTRWVNAEPDVAAL